MRETHRIDYIFNSAILEAAIAFIVLASLPTNAGNPVIYHYSAMRTALLSVAFAFLIFSVFVAYSRAQTPCKYLAYSARISNLYTYLLSNLALVLFALSITSILLLWITKPIVASPLLPIMVRLLPVNYLSAAYLSYPVFVTVMMCYDQLPRFF